MTELSPLDILGVTFSKRLHGYDRDQVQRFLNLLPYEPGDAGGPGSGEPS